MSAPKNGDLLPRLFVELFQTEESACKHPQVEADRLGGSPPGLAMVAVSAHARRALPEIERLAEAEGLKTTSAGVAIGDALSAFRKLLVDRAVDREKSYRGTLVGIHHGVDVVRLLRAAARAVGRDRIVATCDAWLSERIPLVAVAVGQLDWFGANPRLALQPATEPLGKRK